MGYLQSPFGVLNGESAMCGICGIVNFESENLVEEKAILRMRDVMIHRGPDDQGIYIHQNVGLGFRRLSIIDLVSGNQPMSNEKGDIWIVYNGEIYNHLQLRENLISGGHKYKTTSDTESIIHLYEEEGIELFRKLNGMFGMAIWDDFRKRLVLARDRLGIKPLYYTLTPEGLVFASEIKSLLENKKVKRELNHERIGEYLTFRYLSGEETMFKDIFSLLPGHLLILEKTNVTIRKFWDLPPPGEKVNMDEERMVEEIAQQLKDSVKLRLMSDVPLGCFCSGGIDSSLTSAYAAQQVCFPLNTFSVGFYESDFDESYFAQLIAQKYQTVHHEIKLDNYQFADSLPQLIWHNDEPLNHPNSVMLYHLSKLAKQSVTVVLTGEGSDELFAGYPRYFLVKIYSYYQSRPPFLQKIFKLLVNFSRERRIRKVKEFLPLSLADAAILNSSFVHPNIVSKLILEETSRNYTGKRDLYLDENPTLENLLENLIRLELRTYLVSILNRQDKMSMAASIEARVPFLDYRLVELGATIPESYKLKGLQTKYVIKRLGERILPREVVHRKKSGFGVPLSAWLKDKKGLGRYLDLFFEPDFKKRGYWDIKEIHKLVKQHQEGKADNGEILWALINLELWSKTFLEDG
jgi:asparagine synthase (glutamine-hydrolysing)